MFMCCIVCMPRCFTAHGVMSDKLQGASEALVVSFLCRFAHSRFPSFPDVGARDSNPSVKRVLPMAKACAACLRLIPEQLAEGPGLRDPDPPLRTGCSPKTQSRAPCRLRSVAAEVLSTGGVSPRASASQGQKCASSSSRRDQPLSCNSVASVSLVWSARAHARGCRVVIYTHTHTHTRYTCAHVCTHVSRGIAHRTRGKRTARGG